MSHIGLFLLIAIPVTLTVFLAIMARNSKSAPRRIPEDISDAPNYVISSDKDSPRYVEPLENRGLLISDIKLAIEEIGGKVVSENRQEVSAEFSTSIFGFVDDVLVTLPNPLPQSVEPYDPRIQFFSASRVGHSDLGANRARIEKLKAVLNRMMDEKAN